MPPVKSYRGTLFLNLKSLEAMQQLNLFSDDPILYAVYKSHSPADLSLVYSGSYFDIATEQANQALEQLYNEYYGDLSDFLCDITTQDEEPEEPHVKIYTNAGPYGRSVLHSLLKNGVI